MKPVIQVWEGEHFVVTRTGTGQCLLKRWSGQTLDRFGSELEAIAVAEYCDAQGGSYTAPIRKAAKLRFAQLSMPAAPPPMNAIEAAAPQAESARARMKGGAA